MKNIQPIIVRGGGDIATGTIVRLYKSGFPVIILETKNPSAIRREVSFCEAIYKGEMEVEGIRATSVSSFIEAYDKAVNGELPIIVDPNMKCLDSYSPDILIDAIIAKKNLGTRIDMAKRVISLGPGFFATKDCHFVIETMRGHNLGRIIKEGSAIKNTNTPGLICGVGRERVVHSKYTGKIKPICRISDIVEKDEIIAYVENETGEYEIKSNIRGVLRGIIKEGFFVKEGLKIADVDPRIEEKENCFTISDKARNISGSVLELVNDFYNR